MSRVVLPPEVPHKVWVLAVRIDPTPEGLYRTTVRASKGALSVEEVGQWLAHMYEQGWLANHALLFSRAVSQDEVNAWVATRALRRHPACVGAAEWKGVAPWE